MKKFDIPCLLVGLMISFACTRQENQDHQGSHLCEGADTLAFLIPCGHSFLIKMPDCFTITVQSGVDSYVGKFSADTEDVQINYDIGTLAGYYIAVNSPNKQVFQSVNQVFWYEKKNGRLYFTFPNAGPANFYTESEAFADDILQFMKTVEYN